MIHRSRYFQAQATTKRSDSEFASSIESDDEPVMCGIAHQPQLVEAHTRYFVGKRFIRQLHYS
jgi:hypothetical protein